MLLLPLFPLFSKMYLNLHFLNLVKFVVKGGRLLYFYELCHLWFQFPAQLCGGRSRFNVSYLLISWRTASVAFDAPSILAVAEMNFVKLIGGTFSMPGPKLLR